MFGAFPFFNGAVRRRGIYFLRTAVDRFNAARARLDPSFEMVGVFAPVAKVGSATLVDAADEEAPVSVARRILDRVEVRWFGVYVRPHVCFVAPVSDYQEPSE